MKKVILMAVVVTFLMSSCHKASSMIECKGKYTKDGMHYPTYAKQGKCFYNKGLTTFGYRQIPIEYCPCL